MSEIVIGSSECGHGGLHIWPESGLVEILDDEQDTPLPPEETGRLVVTGLFNADMPLIRYQTGDRGSLAPEGEKCTCGRNLPLIRKIEGRMNDLVITRDGRRIFWLNPVFYNLPIREGQIIQDSLEQIRVLYVPATGFRQEHAAMMKQRLLERVGEMEIDLQALDCIPRAPNGKLPTVISRLSTRASNFR
jgi:phenylacetate-CoA ligase